MMIDAKIVPVIMGQQTRGLRDYWLQASTDYIGNIVLVGTNIKINLKCDCSTTRLTLLRQVM